MRTFRNFFLLCALLLGTFVPASGQTAEGVRMRRYGIGEGLPNEQARRVVAMPDGRMLVEVEGMFALFDGERFRPMEYDRSQSVQVESFLNTDYWFAPDSSLLWVKDTHHLFAIEPRAYRFVSPTERLAQSGVEQPLKNFFIDHDGQAWLHAADDCLYRYDWNHPARRMMEITQTNTDGLLATVCDVVQVGTLHYVLLSNDLLICLDAAQPKVLWSQPIGQPWGGFRLKAQVWDDRTLLIRTRDELVAFDIPTRQMRSVLAENNIYDFRRVGTDLWVSGRQRIVRLDRQLNPVEEIRQAIDDATGEPLDGNWQGLALDHQGGLWVCTFSQGLAYRGPNRLLARYEAVGEDDVFARVFSAKLNGTVLPADLAVTDIVAGRATWVATRQQGLLRILDGHTDTYTPQNVEGIWGSVAFVAPLKDGRLLFSCHLNRLGLLNPDTHHMDNLTERYPQLLRFRNMVDICQVQGGWLVGTQNGFFYLDERTLTPDLQHFDALNANPWSDKCNCLMRDSQGIIWIGTQNGLLRYDERTGDLHRFSTDDGLPSSCIQSIVEDKTHCLWIATIAGIARWNGTDFLLLGTDDGLRDLKFLERAASVDAEGLVRFGTAKGIYTINPSQVVLPRLRLVPQLMAGGTDDMVFPYDQNYLTFDISALNYGWSAHTIYRYRLVGLDREWTEVAGGAGKIQVHFTGLAPGHYTLEVEAAMQGQPWGERLSLPLRITPPWWQSWWAETLYVLLALALVWFFVQAYLREQRNKIEIERREAQIRQLLEQVRLRSQLPEETKAEHQEEIKISAQDEAFLQKAMSCVEKNLDNSDYGVEAFSGDMAMERSTLYRRMQAVVSQSPTEFMRTVRLKRAAELLRTEKYTVGEVSDMTGFPNRKAFSKYFKDAFGVLPSQY